ncbi:MAG: hypothetical protein EG828_16080 [Deltaproteobacteria bacterium]|nr:hypothetical protein [Deltaproteobacteria bacterium]
MEDYCRLPLEQKRSAVLELYFDSIRIAPVRFEERWAHIAALLPLFPSLQTAEGTQDVIQDFGSETDQYLWFHFWEEKGHAYSSSIL